MSTPAYIIPDPELGLQSEPYLLDPSGTDIGRATENGIAIPVDSLSRRHARIDYSAEEWTITDLGSSNGTFVNGDLVKTQTLHDGDVITLGKVSFTFRQKLDSLDDNTVNEQSSGLRLVAEEDDSSIILLTKSSDKTSYKSLSPEQTTEQHLAALNQRLLALYNLNDVLRDATRREVIIAALMNLVFENLPADRGVVLNFREGTQDLVPELFRFRQGDENREFRLSRSITQRALTEQVAVLSRDVRMDSRFKSSESIMSSDIRSAMCVPLTAKRTLLGLLVLDTKEATHAFTEDDLAFVSALATDAAMTLENLALMEENIRQERLAAVGQTISGLAHNIKNILQLARGSVELIDNAVAKKEMDNITALWPIARRSIERMQVLTHEMLDFSRQSKPQLAPADINEILRSLEEMVQSDKRTTKITVKVECDPHCPKPLIDADGLSKSIMNLMSNAFDALAGRENAAVTLCSESGDQHVIVRVKDNGPGIPEELMPRIFQPFFSTKGNKGNGLGLAMTRKYLEDMGARVEVKSHSDIGCEFILYLANNNNFDQS